MGLFRPNRDALPSTSQEVELWHPAEIESARILSEYQIRTPSVATLSAKAGMSFGGGSFGSDFDVERAVRDFYLANVFLYSCVRAVADDVSSLSLRVGADPERPNDYDTKNPLAMLLGPSGRPSGIEAKTTARQLWRWTVGQKITTGKWGWEIDPAGYVWPLISTKIKPIPTTGGPTYFAGFEYDIGQGQKKKIPVDRIVYHWDPAASDWRCAESVLQPANLTLKVAIMQDLYDEAFLRNDARPATIVVHERFGTLKDRDAWRRQYTDTHRGARAAGKVLFVEAGDSATGDGAGVKDAISVQTLGLSQRDAEFIKRHDQKVAEILTAMDVPLSRLANASGKTFANAHEEIESYWRSRVRSVAIDLAECINTDLAPLFGSNVAWWDFTENEYLRAEPLFTPDLAILGYKALLLTREEARVEGFGLAPVPADGMGVLADPSAAPAAPAPPVAAVTPNPDALPVAASVQLLQIVRAAVRAELDERPTPVETAADLTAEDERARRVAQYRAFVDKVEPLERRWTRQFQRFLDRQRDSVLSRLNGKRGRQAIRETTIDVDAVFNQTHWLEETATMSAGLYEDVLDLAFVALEALVGIAFTTSEDFAVAFIKARANQLAGQVTSTTYDAIKAQLAEGAVAGEGIPDLADRIRNLFDQTYAARAETVARTEVISGYNGGTAAAAEKSDGAIAKMEWLATSDSRTRDAHISADGQIRPVGEAFDVGGESLKYPGDPSGSPENVVNCRCTVIPIAAPTRTAKVIPLHSAGKAAIAIARGMPVMEALEMAGLR